MKRRTFIATASAGGAALLWPGALPAAPHAGQAPFRGAVPPRSDDPAYQHLHADAQTAVPGLEYFFLGNGQLTAVVQHATGAALAAGQTPLGLLLWDPHHFARKWSTFTFHPEWGLRRGMVSVRVDETAYALDPATLRVERAVEEGVPVVVARWAAGPHQVEERYWVAAEAPLLLRTLRLVNGGGATVPVAFTTTLYYNHILFTDYRTDHAAGVLRADGYHHLELFADRPVALADRYMTVDAGTAPPGGAATAVLSYAIGVRKEAVGAVAPGARWARTREAWAETATFETPEAGLNGLYDAARRGLRAAVATSGRFDASLWQYNMEWVMDATGVVQAACRTGQHDLAAAVLTNILTRLVNERGIAAHASRFHDTLNTELNQQGALLGAVWTYWAWTGDLGLVRGYWEVLRRVADFPLEARYLHASGLPLATIELYERDASAGILPGFDVAHAASLAWGLEKAADLARRLGHAAEAARWQAAGTRMRTAMLEDPRYALVDDGVLIKRRLADGSRQRVLRPEAAGADHIPPGSPLAREKEPLLDPDTGTVWPILYGQVDPAGPLARRTLDAVATLWNDEGGGYLRYHASSDPDAPGGWTFPTAMVGHAMARAGRGAEVRRVLDWLTSVQGARGGAYFEIYARQPRPVPPLPPMGLIVWGWAEIASLLLGGIVGAEPDAAGETLVLDPHLPDGLDAVQASLRFRGHRLAVHLSRGTTPGARFNDTPLPRGPGGYRLPTPVRSGRLDVILSTA